MSKVVIVRHGDTFAPGEPVLRIGRRTDLPLTGAGAAQAQALGRWFATQGRSFRDVLIAPSIRATQTAADILVFQADPAVPRTAAWLAEIDHGPDEGRSEDEVQRRLGRDQLRAWDEHAIAPEGWIVDADERLAAWCAFFSPPPAGDVLPVTSNGAARFALLASGKRPSGTSLKLRTGACGEMLCRDGEVKLMSWDVRPPPESSPART